VDSGGEAANGGEHVVVQNLAQRKPVCNGFGIIFSTKQLDVDVEVDPYNDINRSMIIDIHNSS
jgi:hypothetical protein